MKKLLLILLPFLFLNTLPKDEENYLYYIEHKETDLFDELLNGEERTAYVFQYDLDYAVSLRAHMYEDGKEITYLGTLLDRIDPGYNKLFMALDYNDETFTFFSNDLYPGLSSYRMQSSRRIYKNCFHNITYIRTEKEKLEIDTKIPILVGEYEENGHHYKFEIAIEKAIS